MSVKSVFSFPRCLLAMAITVSIGFTSIGVVAQEGTKDNAGQATVTEKPTSKPPVPAAGTSKPEKPPKLFPDGLPNLALFLKSGLERHPDVVVARSKMEAARAELLKAEAMALKELVQLHHNVQSKQVVVDMLKGQHAAAQIPYLKFQTEAAELNQLEWEAALALGFSATGKLNAGPATGRHDANSETPKSAPLVFVDLAYPKGVHADRIKENPELQLEILDATLADFGQIIKDKTGIPIVFDNQGLSDSGIAIDNSDINIVAKDAPLASILQQLEDRSKSIGLCFVVRDYGILVTTRDAAPQDAVSALDFIKLEETEIRTKQRTKLEAEAQQMREGGGGMGGGGGFF